jgi:hypothetical protein
MKQTMTHYPKAPFEAEMSFLAPASWEKKARGIGGVQITRHVDTFPLSVLRGSMLDGITHQQVKDFSDAIDQGVLRAAIARLVWQREVTTA